MSEHLPRPTTVTPEDDPDELSATPPTGTEALGADPRWAGASGESTRPEPSRRPGALETGTTIAGRYRLESPIAAGGMATVWRATDAVLTRPVAVKVLHAHLAADPEFVARFRREAVAAARLAHPSIVAIYDTCDDPEAIVMEMVDGRTLRDELDARGFLPAGEAVAIASSICQALDVAHKAGIVHRDVKPANVLLSSGGQLKVADFGIAKAARAAVDDDLPDLTAIGRMVGTAKYLAPEQVSGGDVDPRSDVYAVGAVLYEMVCGRPPFTGDNDLAVATARLHGPPDRPRTVLRTMPARLDEVIMRALATDPDDRYPSASALWADLQTCPISDDEVRGPIRPVTERTDATEQPSFARSERSWLVPAMLVSLVAVALGLAWVLIGGTEALDIVDRVRPGGGTTEASDDPAPLTFGAATSFDPPSSGGDGTEHEGDAGLAIDGDPQTAWTTETYDTRQDFVALKDGVGLVLDLGDTAAVDEVVLRTSNTDWSATVHLAEDAGSSLGDWGEPAGNVSGAGAGDTAIELDGAEGRYVLVWLTDLGSRSFELQEAAASGR